MVRIVLENVNGRVTQRVNEWFQGEITFHDLSRTLRRGESEIGNISVDIRWLLGKLLAVSIPGFDYLLTPLLTPLKSSFSNGWFMDSFTRWMKIVFGNSVFALKVKYDTETPAVADRTTLLLIRNEPCINHFVTLRSIKGLEINGICNTRGWRFLK